MALDVDSSTNKQTTRLFIMYHETNMLSAPHSLHNTVGTVSLNNSSILPIYKSEIPLTEDHCFWKKAKITNLKLRIVVPFML